MYQAKFSRAGSALAFLAYCPIPSPDIYSSLWLIKICSQEWSQNSFTCSPTGIQVVQTNLHRGSFAIEEEAYLIIEK